VLSCPFYGVTPSSECFSYIKDWVEKKVRRHLARAQKRRFGLNRRASPQPYPTVARRLMLPGEQGYTLVRPVPGRGVT
jgi:hypothetical protein